MTEKPKTLKGQAIYDKLTHLPMNYKTGLDGVFRFAYRVPGGLIYSKTGSDTCFVPFTDFDISDADYEKQTTELTERHLWKFDPNEK